MLLTSHSPSPDAPSVIAGMGDTPVIDKKRRYDRQLRIWGEAGQAQLESAHVCLLTCGPTGTEALKNLVLGGIAAFTLVDGAKVTPADLGNKCVCWRLTSVCQQLLTSQADYQFPGGRYRTGQLSGSLRSRAAERTQRFGGWLLR